MKSCINAIPASQSISENELVASKVWRGPAPSKAELLVWFLILGRLNTRDRLRRLNVLRINDLSCPLCNSKVESTSHLFFSCKFAWELWGLCC